MEARVTSTLGSFKAGRRRKSRTLAMIVAAVGLPVILAIVLVHADIRTDLTELKPVSSVSGATAITGWSDLKNTDGERTRMLGYMMDGYVVDATKADGLNLADGGAQIDMFILLPQAGHAFHAARRDPEAMVEVWLLRRAAVEYRSLVWVSGVLERTSGPLDPYSALYAMKDAAVKPAAQVDITRWFQP